MSEFRDLEQLEGVYAHPVHRDIVYNTPIKPYTKYTIYFDELDNVDKRLKVHEVDGVKTLVLVIGEIND